MFECNDASLLAVQARAERELAAFLRAASEVPGQNNMPRAGDAWLQAMETLDCPDDDEKFFRRVTILAIAQLIEDSRSPMHNEHPGRGVNRLAVARTAA